MWEKTKGTLRFYDLVCYVCMVAIGFLVKVLSGCVYDFVSNISYYVSGIGGLWNSTLHRGIQSVHDSVWLRPHVYGDGRCFQGKPYVTKKAQKNECIGSQAKNLKA